MLSRPATGSHGRHEVPPESTGHPPASVRAMNVTIARSGRDFRLTSRQRVAADLDRCFAFFSDAANLESLTPPFLQFEILTPLPIAMREGALIEYQLRLMGLPMRWLTRIDAWEPGRGFTDVQLRGPYAKWHHRHAFEPADGGTWVLDQVDYRLPLAPLSAPAHALFVRPRLLEIFGYRGRAVERLLG